MISKASIINIKRKMKRIVLMVISTFICGIVFINCNSREKNLTVSLISQEGFGPFTLGQLIIAPGRDSLIYVNVPEDIDEYVVRNCIIEPGQNVLFLIGTRGDKRVIMVDSNNDKDFGNEKILEYNYPLSIEEQKEIQNSLPTISTQFEFLENGKIFTKNAKIKPTPYLGSLRLSFNTDNEIEKKYYLFVSIPEHKKGEINVNGVDFTVFVSNKFTRMDYLKEERVSIFITPEPDALLSELEGNIPYIIGDVFNVKGHDYLIDSISKWGDKLFINYIGKNERPEGISEGYYLPKFEAKYLDNTVFDIAKYSGKYVLLDFWGTWCAPCIKLIPELKKLNDDFSDKNFALISVAYDDDPGKITDFIIKEDMNWPHLFVNKNQNDANSVTGKLKVTKYPTTILISPDGKIAGRDLALDKLRELLTEKTTDL